MRFRKRRKFSWSQEGYGLFSASPREKAEKRVAERLFGILPALYTSSSMSVAQLLIRRLGLRS